MSFNNNLLVILLLLGSSICGMAQSPNGNGSFGNGSYGNGSFGGFGWGGFFNSFFHHNGNQFNNPCKDFRTRVTLNAAKDSIKISVNKPAKIIASSNYDWAPNFNLQKDTTIKVIPGNYSFKYELYNESDSLLCTNYRSIVVNHCDKFNTSVKLNSSKDSLLISANKISTVTLKSRHWNSYTFMVHKDTAIRIEPSSYYVYFTSMEEDGTKGCNKVRFAYVSPCHNYKADTQINETQDGIYLSATKHSKVTIQSDNDMNKTFEITTDTMIPAGPARYYVQYHSIGADGRLGCRKVHRVNIDSCSDYEVSGTLNEAQDTLTLSVNTPSQIIWSSHSITKVFNIVKDTILPLESSGYTHRILYQKIEADGSILCQKSQRIYIDACRGYEASAVLNTTKDSITVSVSQKSEITFWNRRFKMESFQVTSDTTFVADDSYYFLYCRAIEVDGSIGCRKFIKITNQTGPEGRKKGGFASASTAATTNKTVPVYPNPASNQAFVNLSAYYGQTVSLSIYNQAGALVYQNKQIRPTGSAEEVPVQDLQSGIYFVKIQTANELPITKKLVIKK